MNIFIFDQDYENNPVNYIQPLLDNIKDLNAAIFNDLDKAKKIIDQYPYDFVIIDFSTPDGKAFLEYLLSIKAKQKIITISYELRSSQGNCDECEKKYNKRRLIKPIDAVDVYHTIQNFDTAPCKYINHFNNPSILVQDLMNRYDYFKYNTDTKTIVQNIYDNDHILREYIDIIDTLNQYDIRHEIVAEYEIKIL